MQKPDDRNTAKRELPTDIAGFSGVGVIGLSGIPQAHGYAFFRAETFLGAIFFVATFFVDFAGLIALTFLAGLFTALFTTAFFATFLTAFFAAAFFATSFFGMRITFAAAARLATLRGPVLPVGIVVLLSILRIR
jgi:hypothetical protein